MFIPSTVDFRVTHGTAVMHVEYGKFGIGKTHCHDAWNTRNDDVVVVE